MGDTVERYETDFVLWAAHQSQALREAAASGANLPLDWLNLAEEVEGLGRSERHQLRSRIITVIEHLLKLQFSTRHDPRSGWRSTVRRSRDEIVDLLDANPSLRREVHDMIRDQVSRASWRMTQELDDRNEMSPASRTAIEGVSYTSDEILRDWFPPEPTV